MSPLESLETFFNGKGGNHAPTVCGRNSFLWQAGLEYSKGGAKELATILETYEQSLDPKTKPPDTTLGKRVKGFRATLEAKFADAVTAFDAARYPKEINEAISPFSPDENLQTSLKTIVPILPPLTTPGGWIVYDMLWHLQAKTEPAAPLSRAEVPILLDNTGPGTLAKIVVELMPGPAGLVTPDWWAMGLMRFPSQVRHQKVDNFVESTQELLRKIWKNQPNRLRWRLEGWQQGDPPDLVHGRSGEGAVACAALSVLFSQSADPEERKDAELNATIGITATVNADHRPVKDWTLGTVTDVSIPNKFHAAGIHGLTEVVVAKGQGPEPRPITVASHEVNMLGEAYFELQQSNRFIRNYLNDVETRFFSKWHLEETLR